MAIDFRADPTPPRTKGWVPRGQGQVKLVPGWEPRPEYGAGQIGDPFDPQGGDPESYPAPPDLPPSISPSTPPPLPSVPKPTPSVYSSPQTQALSSPTPSPAPAASTTGAPSPPRSAVAGTPPTRTPSQQSFLDEMVPTAKKVSADTGIPWQVLVSIPANETGWGSAVFHNNYFGIKGPGAAAKTWEVIDGKRVDITDSFRTFDSPQDAMMGFAQFLNDNSRYKPALAYLKDNPADWGEFVRQIHKAGYATDPQWSNKVINIGEGLKGATLTAGGPSGGVSNVASNAPRTSVRQISQFGDPTLTAQEAYAACGPAAAVRFASLYGRNPTLREATDMAKTVGWTSGGGMAGIDSEQKLLTKMGVPTHMIGPSWDTIQKEATSGNPVTISTPGHYYFVDGYDASNGTYHVGQSGLDLKGGSEWMTAEQMESRMGKVQGALLADNPVVGHTSLASTEGGGRQPAQGSPTRTTPEAVINPITKYKDNGDGTYTATHQDGTTEIVRNVTQLAPVEGGRHPSTIKTPTTKGGAGQEDGDDADDAPNWSDMPKDNPALDFPTSAFDQPGARYAALEAMGWRPEAINRVVDLQTNISPEPGQDSGVKSGEKMGEYTPAETVGGRLAQGIASVAEKMPREGEAGNDLMRAANAVNESPLRNVNMPGSQPRIDLYSGPIQRASQPIQRDGYVTPQYSYTGDYVTPTTTYAHEAHHAIDLLDPTTRDRLLNHGQDAATVLNDLTMVRQSAAVHGQDYIYDMANQALWAYHNDPTHVGHWLVNLGATADTPEWFQDRYFNHLLVDPGRSGAQAQAPQFKLDDPRVQGQMTPYFVENVPGAKGTSPNAGPKEYGAGADLDGDGYDDDTGQPVNQGLGGLLMGGLQSAGNVVSGLGTALDDTARAAQAAQDERDRQDEQARQDQADRLRQEQEQRFDPQTGLPRTSPLDIGGAFSDLGTTLRDIFPTEDVKQQRLAQAAEEEKQRQQATQVRKPIQPVQGPSAPPSDQPITPTSPLPT